MNFQVVIEHGPENLSAYVPDLPGCVVTGKTLDQIRDRMQKAIQLHIMGLIEDGEEVPTPGTHALTVSVPVQQYRAAIATRRKSVTPQSQDRSPRTPRAQKSKKR
ncbi:MAG: hypothetical protein GEEBNDBF_00888 [bacterium]|nr:hypothetical protein [bacterium]